MRFGCMWMTNQSNSNSAILLGTLLTLFLSACSSVNLRDMEHMPYIPSQGAGDIERGRILFRDEALGGSGNDKSCHSCHKKERELAGVTRKNYDSLFGYITRDVEDVINLCIVLPLKGKPYVNDSQEMADLLAYLRSIE